jgi:hypothetical protein
MGCVPAHQVLTNTTGFFLVHYQKIKTKPQTFPILIPLESLSGAAMRMVHPAVSIGNPAL